MDTIINNFITDKTVDKILAGLPLEFKEVANKQETILVALHCVLNGPVGVNKTTNFPLFKTKTTIKLVTGVNVSNKSWKGFCRHIAEYLISARYEPDCNSRRRLGTFWPLKEW